MREMIKLRFENRFDLTQPRTIKVNFSDTPILQSTWVEPDTLLKDVLKAKMEIYLWFYGKWNT